MLIKGGRLVALHVSTQLPGVQNGPRWKWQKTIPDKVSYVGVSGVSTNAKKAKKSKSHESSWEISIKEDFGKIEAKIHFEYWF